jgi:hypothetical protein
MGADVVSDEIFAVDIEHSKRQTILLDLDGLARGDFRRLAQREILARTTHS